MATYQLVVTAKNDVGEDTDVLNWVIKPRVIAHSNVVGGHFTTVGKPELTFPEAIETRFGSDGLLDLNVYNTGSESTEWSYVGSLPPGVKWSDSGELYYENIGWETNPMANVSVELDRLLVALKRLEEELRRVAEQLKT